MQNRKILIGKSLSSYNKIILTWTVTIIIISLFGNYTKIDIANTDIYRYYILLFPSIESWSISTKYQDTIRLVWVYMTFSGPLVLILMLKQIENVRVNHLHKKEIFAYLIVFLLFFYSCFVGVLDGEIPISSSYRFSKLYYYSLFWAVAISIAQWVVLVSCALIFICIIKHNISDKSSTN